MANLAAVDVSNMMRWGGVQVYSVGAPRVGNHAYARMYNKLVPDTWGIINYRVMPPTQGFSSPLPLYAPCRQLLPGKLVLACHLSAIWLNSACFVRWRVSLTYAACSMTAMLNF